MGSTRRILIGLAAVLAVAHGEPWATGVVAYTAGSGVNVLYTNPTRALGRPTVDTELELDVVPVAPVYAPWLPDELVVLGAGGSLTVAFDHPVEDDPDNPYGVDLLVFGNAFLNTQSGNDYVNDPANTLVGTGIFEEPATVSVSQDGTNWFSFSSGPFADGMLPTLGRVWTGSTWGEPTDPTIPPDPSLAPSDLAGMSVAELSRRYRGGAGGTGFDLGTLPLPVNASGRKWCRYVRLDVTTGTSEIDALCDVAPADAQRLWRIRHFDWTYDPAQELTVPRLVTTGVDTLTLTLTLPASAGEEPWILQTATLATPHVWQDLQSATGGVTTVDGDWLIREIPIATPSNRLVRLYLQEAP